MRLAWDHVNSEFHARGVLLERAAKAIDTLSALLATCAVYGCVLQAPVQRLPSPAVRYMPHFRYLQYVTHFTHVTYSRHPRKQRRPPPAVAARRDSLPPATRVTDVTDVTHVTGVTDGMDAGWARLSSSCDHRIMVIASDCDYLGY